MYTLPPWKFSFNKTQNLYSIKNASGCTLAIVNCFPETALMFPESLPNAKLIASAPQILEALEQLTMWVESCNYEPKEYMAAKKLINKIKGQQ